MGSPACNDYWFRSKFHRLVFAWALRALFHSVFEPRRFSLSPFPRPSQGADMAAYPPWHDVHGNAISSYEVNATVRPSKWMQARRMSHVLWSLKSDQYNYSWSVKCRAREAKVGRTVAEVRDKTGGADFGVGTNEQTTETRCLCEQSLYSQDVALYEKSPSEMNERIEFSMFIWFELLWAQP